MTNNRQRDRLVMQSTNTRKVTDMQNDIKTNKTNKTTNTAPSASTQANHWYDRDNGIIGFMLFLAVLSIGYSTYMVALAPYSLVAKALLVPQVLLAATIAVRKFTK